jgi:GAF domain-containing protein
MATKVELVDLLRRFASTMARSFDVNDVLYELCDTTVEVLGAAGAGVSVETAGRLEFVTATDERIVGVERVQQEHQRGPCVEAFNRGEVVALADVARSDLARADGWDDYRRAAAEAGIVAVLGLPLLLDGLRVGSLNVYDTSRRDWSEADLESARVIADVATAYLVRTGELAEERQLTRQLQGALDSRVVIEQAKGMISRDHAASVDAAFETLRSHARRHNLALRDVAASVVDGTLRMPPPG